MQYMHISALFFTFFNDIYSKAGDIISRLRFDTLKEAFMCYGETNLVPIDTLPQILMYARLNCQPVHVCESELPDKKGRIVCWYLKSETRYAYQKWKENRPEKKEEL